MFGIKVHRRRDLVQGIARALILSGQNRIGHQDQASLDQILWPAAKFDVVYYLWLVYLLNNGETLVINLTV